MEMLLHIVRFEPLWFFFEPKETRIFMRAADLAAGARPQLKFHNSFHYWRFLRFEFDNLHTGPTQPGKQKGDSDGLNLI